MYSRHHTPGRRKWCWVLDSMALARASAWTSTGGILRGPWAGHFPSPCLVSLVGAEGPGLGPRKGHDFRIPFCLHTCPLVCGSLYVHQLCWVSLLPREIRMSDPQGEAGQEKIKGLARVLQNHRAVLRERPWERQVGTPCARLELGNCL